MASSWRRRNTSAGIDLKILWSPVFMTGSVYFLKLSLKNLATGEKFNSNLLVTIVGVRIKVY